MTMHSEPAPDNHPQPSDLPGSPGRPRDPEGADRSVDRPVALKAAAGLLTCALFVGTIIVGKNIISTTQPATAASAAPGDSSADNGVDAAMKLNQQGRFGEAAALLERVVERHATDQSVRVAYAQALIGQKKYKPAYEQYQAAIALMDPTVTSVKPGSTEAAKLVRNPAGAQLNFEAGTCASLAELPGRAVEHYWMAQTLDPSEPKYSLYLAMMQLKTGEDVAANASLLRCVKLKPDMAEAWGTMAELELRQNRLGLAEQHIAEARKFQPDIVRWRVVEARVYNRSNRPEKAAELLLSLRPEQRRDKSLLTVLSESYGLLGKPDEAATMYSEAAAGDFTDAELSYCAAVWLDRAGHPDKAVNYARTAAMQGHQGAKDLLEKLGAQSSAPPHD